MNAQRKPVNQSTPESSPPWKTWHIWIALILWVSVIGGAVVYAPRVGDVLQTQGIVVPGSESEKALAVIDQEIRGGEVQDLVLVFASNSMQVDSPAYSEAVRQTLELVRQVPGVTKTTSYWDTGDEWLVGKDHASTFALVEVARDAAATQNQVVPAIRDRIAAQARGDLSVHVTGNPAINRDLGVVGQETVSRAEKVVVPVVLAVLLIVFGTLVSALMPLALGMISTAVALGLFYVYAVRFSSHTLAANMISMLGMGVGVDYSLFLVTRFREELARGLDRSQAVRVTMTSAGKAVIFSGATVVVSVASLYLVNSPLIRSLAVAMGLVVIVAVLVAVTLLPIGLYLLGDRINALRIPLLGRAGTGTAFWHRWSLAIMRRPWLYVVLATLPLLLLSYPALRMKTGWPNLALLPPEADSRQGFDVLSRQFDAGLAGPIDVVVQLKSGSVADAQHLDQIYALTERLQQDPDVGRVVSYLTLKPGWSLDRYKELYINAPAWLADLPGTLRGDMQQLRSASSSLKAAQDSVAAVSAKVRTGRVTAADLAGIRDALDTASAGLDQGRLGLVSSATDMQAMADKLESLEQQFGRSLLPGQHAFSPRDGAAALQQMAEGLRTMAAQMRQAQAVLGQGGRTSLAGMGQQLDAAGSGLARTTAAIDLAIAQLQQVLDQVETLNAAAGPQAFRLLSLSQDQSTSDAIRSMVNIDRGANVARIVVVPKGGPDLPETMNLVRRLRSEAVARWATDSYTVQVGGITAELVDFDDQMRWALPRVIGGVLLITFVVMLVLLRSLLLPFKAIVMNTLSIMVAYGALVLVFEKGYLAPLLGFTPLGYVESPIIVVLFAVLFGLSMDYEVFLLTRMKEAHDQTGDNEESVAIGLEHTAGVITGAAAIMVVVFGAFLLTGTITIKEFGFGLAFAVLVDATIIRMVLVPAFMRLAGRWNWWAPRWLLKLLPSLDIRH